MLLCPLRVGPVLLAVLLASAACGSRDPIPAAPRGLRSDEVEQALARELRIAPVPAKGGTNPSRPIFPTRETLAEFYADYGQRLAWCDESGGILPSATTLLDALRRAPEHGLDPEDYALSRLDRLRGRLGTVPQGDAAFARLADFDLLMTAAFFRYASDLATGRVHPEEIRNDWHASTPEMDLPTNLRQALEGGTLSKLLEALPPPHPGYGRLREALRALREVEAAGGWPAIPDGPKLLQGSRGARVALLRQRLSEPAGERFDLALAASVRRFQEQHGIEPDGRVGAMTLGELNVTAGERMRQVELNLERWRWIPRRLGDPHVFANIPAFDLELVRGESSVWRTRIVVGQAFTPTPVFSDRIVAVVINPPWNVPESIALAEYLPELRENPKALQRLGLRLLQGSEEHAREIDPTSVHWKALDEGSFPYRLRQDPGPNNALGRVKFQLTNDFNVYLHDTPAQGLFGHTDRDLSHGCIRVEDPLDLARLILDESSQDSLDEAFGQTEERRLPVKPAVPIHIVYLTAWVDETGELQFSPDVYEFDGPQRSALDRTAR
jgi:murein L,D-transpeptidase YcbB/YkuD